MDQEIEILTTEETTHVVVDAPDTYAVVEITDSELVVVPEQTHVVSEHKDVIVVAVGGQGPPGADGAQIDDLTPTLTTTFSGAYIMELLSPFAIGSFSVSPSTAEMGSTVTSLTFNWATNYTPDTISISNGVGSVTPPATSKVASVSITANTTYTLTVVRNGVTKTANATVNFINNVFYGVHTSQTTDESIIEAMTGALSGTRARSINYNCTGGRYFHYAYPSRLGAASFQINNLTYSDVTLTVVPFTNASGLTENYNVYYCNVIQFGASITLVVS